MMMYVATVESMEEKILPKKQMKGEERKGEGEKPLKCERKKKAGKSEITEKETCTTIILVRQL